MEAETFTPPAPVPEPPEPCGVPGRRAAIRRPASRGAMFTAFLSSLVLNLLIVGALLLVAVDEPRRTPPAIVANSLPAPDPTPVEPPEPLQPVVGPVSGSAAAAMDLAIATSTSTLNIAVPEVTRFDNGLAGLEGIGPGFGAGIGETGAGSGREGGSMKIGRMEVRSMRLGVILDVSGSMERILPEVRSEIRKGFSSAEIVNVEGCRLDWRPVEGEDPRRRVTVKRQASSVIEAVEMLTLGAKVDAIYWFSDLQDGETEQGLARLGQLLRLDGSKGQRVKLYVRSLQSPPRRELAMIIRASGGAVQAGDKVE